MCLTLFTFLRVLQGGGTGPHSRWFGPYRFVAGVGSGFWASACGSESTTFGVAPRPSRPIEDGEPEKMVVSSLANPGVAMPSACRSMGLGWELVRSANAYISAAQASSIRPRTEAARNGSSRYIFGRKQQHS